jgi:WD40 repeat protein
LLSLFAVPVCCPCPLLLGSSLFVVRRLCISAQRPCTTHDSASAAARPPWAPLRLPSCPRVGSCAECCSIRTAFSQDASHKTGLDITALDINRDRTHAILAGREILKTVRVQDARIVEDTNLRAAVIHYADHSQARQRDGLGIQDVKWSHGQFGTHIATAAANGKVILYDLNRAGVELARLHEHTRQVHKLAFNPHQGHLLLSASHDTTVRLWDLRDMKKDIMTCNSRDQYAGINGAIYDVQWSPTDAVEFAFGTDNGTIQRWDFRHNKAPKQKITAHDQRTCTSIDWHPDGKHLLSAGVDRTVKVWDFSVDGRRQKPAYVLTTPYPVYRARWRPPYWSHEHSERGAYQCTQLATSYDRDHPVVHVWDFRRPYLPFREINKFASAPSDMLWHSRDTLWTVGREGVFCQNDVHHAPKVVDRRNLQAIAVSPSGEVGAFAQKRPRRRRSAGLAYSENTYLPDAREKRSSPEKSSLRSSADDSLDDSFLSSSLKRHHGRTASNRSARSFVSTPPSDTAPKVMFLTDSMVMHNEAFKPNQIALWGALPGATNVQIFAYLAQKYKAIPLPDPPTLQSYHNLQHVFEQNAEYAQRAAFYRLAETWRLVGASIAVATRRRAELHRNCRRHKHKPTTIASSNVPRQLESGHSEAHDRRLMTQVKPTESGLVALQRDNRDPFTKGTLELNRSTSPGLSNPALRALTGATDPHHAGQAFATAESSSNLATPLARPFKASTASASDVMKHHLPDPDHAEDISLPPAVAGPHSERAGFLMPESANRSQAPERPSFKGPQWYKSADDLDDRRAMVGSWRAPPRIPLSLEPTDAQGIEIQIPPRLDRHDSDESFAMFSASSDSQRGNSMPSSLASGKSRTMESIPEKWQHPPGDSSFGKPRHGLVAGVEQADGLGKSVQISPTTIPIGKGLNGTSAHSGHDTQQGSGRSETDHPVEFSSTEKAVQDMETLHRNNQLLRHDSSESEAYTSSGGAMSVSSLAGYSHDMEASGTIVPEGFERARSPQALRPPAHLPHATESAPPVLESAQDSLLLSDFQAMHVDVEEDSPFAVIGLLKNILAFYAGSLSDAQTSSLLILLLAPLLPQTQSLSAPSDIDVSEVLTAFADTFTALGLSPTQARAVLSTQLTQLISTGINPYQAEAILQTYHAQLHSLFLYNSAASLRRLAYPTYPAVYDQALKDTQVGLLCLSCKSPINNPKDKMRCESCKRAQAPCAVCWGRYPAFELVTAKKKAKAKLRSTIKGRDHRRKRSSLLSAVDDADGLDEPSPFVPEVPTPPKATLWTWCSLCGHGGHTNCLSTWFAAQSISDGACATEGCLCDCVQGKRREDKIRELLEHKAEKERSKVVRKGDDWKVHESKAVAAIRGTLGETARDPMQNAGLASVPSQGRREEQRRVRVVEPHA